MVNQTTNSIIPGMAPWTLTTSDGGFSTSEWKYCPQCGHGFVSEARYCAHCGAARNSRYTAAATYYSAYQPIQGSWTLPTVYTNTAMRSDHNGTNCSEAAAPANNTSGQTWI